MALACVAMIDRPIVYHLLSSPPRRYWAAFLMPRVFHVPYATIAASVSPKTAQSMPLTQ